MKRKVDKLKKVRTLEEEKGFYRKELIGILFKGCIEDLWLCSCLRSSADKEKTMHSSKHNKSESLVGTPK